MRLDMVVGMQYGDEGKGASCAMLHVEKGYNFSLRVGGSQAEHRFRRGEHHYRCRVLPSATCYDRDVVAYLGPGHIIRDDILQYEIATHLPRHVIIHPNAAVVDGSSMVEAASDNLKARRGGYGMGMSNTLCKKIRRDGSVTLAKAVYDRYIGDFFAIPDKTRGLVEGTQGALLSLNHGDYPYVTSTDTTAPAVMAMAGLGPDFINCIYGVVRCIPMRVAGNSGPFMGEEIDFDIIEKEVGITIPEERKYQTALDGSPDGAERIARFSVEEFTRALMLNTPDQIILTHTDWVTPKVLDIIISNIENTGTLLLGRRLPVTYIRTGDDVVNYEKF